MPTRITVWKILSLTIGILFFQSCTPRLEQRETSEKPNAPHNGVDTSDWEGVYTGNLPCADCAGIRTTLRLKRDLTFEIQKVYSGKSDSAYRQNGTFLWNEAHNKITLKNIDGTYSESVYFVGENSLTQLDASEKRISGDSAKPSILIKVPLELVEKYWKLMELYGRPLMHDNDYKREPHIIFKSDNNRLQGNGGCNVLIGNYEIMNGNRIAFSHMITGQMACSNMDVERQFLKALTSTDSYVIRGDTLSLMRARMAPLARFIAVYLK